jgi:hypothetical protein
VTQVDFVTQFPKNPTNQNGLFQLDAPNLYVGMTRGSGLLFLCSNTMLLNLWGLTEAGKAALSPMPEEKFLKL